MCITLPKLSIKSSFRKILDLFNHSEFGSETGDQGFQILCSLLTHPYLALLHVELSAYPKFTNTQKYNKVH
jgi:hypothetical protein